MEKYRLSYAVLRAIPDRIRGESLNYGIGIFTHGGFEAWIDDAAFNRLKYLHPDYKRWNASEQVRDIKAFVNKSAEIDQQKLLLSLLTSDSALPMGDILIDAELSVAEQVEDHAADLLRRLVTPQAATLASAPRLLLKRPSKLQVEVRKWLIAAKAFSRNAEDLNRNKVVGNYPIAPADELYADFAFLNGKLHVIETLDLRGIEKLTPGLRGDAAIRGITLDTARDKVDGKLIALVSATDYDLARPAINLISRFADDVLDMHKTSDRQKLANFIGSALHRDQLPSFQEAVSS